MIAQHYTFEEMPEIIPVFPLTGVLLLPRALLPLNIFEPRYLEMVDDAIKTNRLIGLAQPLNLPKQITTNGSGLYRTGCVGRITSFQETDDGRYLITLKGIARFHIQAEIQSGKLYRTMRVTWAEFQHDFKEAPALNLNKQEMVSILKPYFVEHGLEVEWDALDHVGDEILLNALAMICPLQPSEKQALLEQKCLKERAELLISLLTMINKSSHDENGNKLH